MTNRQTVATARKRSRLRTAWEVGESVLPKAPQIANRSAQEKQQHLASVKLIAEQRFVIASQLQRYLPSLRTKSERTTERYLADLASLGYIAAVPLRSSNCDGMVRSDSVDTLHQSKGHSKFPDRGNDSLGRNRVDACSPRDANGFTDFVFVEAHRSQDVAWIVAC